MYVVATLRRVSFNIPENFWQKDPKALWQWSTTTPDPDAVRLATFGAPYRDNRPIDGPPVFGAREKDVLFRKQLERSWGFTTGEGARQHIASLLGPYNHATEFDFVLFAGEHLVELERQEGGRTSAWHSRKKDLDAFISQGVEAYGMSGAEAVYQFDCWITLRTSDTFAEACPPRAPLTTKAWDLMRIEIVGGRAVELGWLPVDEYLDYSNRALRALQHHYATWADVAAAFWWGRAIWMADEIKKPEGAKGQLRETHETLSNLLIHPQSPWRMAPLHEETH